MGNLSDSVAKQEYGKGKIAGASSANATTRCGFHTVKKRSAPLPCDFVFSPNFGAWAWTKRRSSDVNEGGNWSSLLALRQKPSNCFSILIRQVSRPGVKPDMVLRGVSLAAAAGPFRLLQQQSLGCRFRAQWLASTNSWSKGQAWDGLAMHADGCAVLASSRAKN